MYRDEGKSSYGQTSDQEEDARLDFKTPGVKDNGAIGIDRKIKVNDVLAAELSIDDGGGYKEVLKALGCLIVDIAQECKDANAPRESRIAGYQESLYLEPPTRRSPIGDGGANIRTSATYTTHCALHAFLVNTIAGLRPVFRAEPVVDGGAPTAKSLERYYDVLYSSHIPMEEIVDTSIDASLRAGMAALKVSWLSKTSMDHTPIPMDDTVAKQVGATPMSSANESGLSYRMKDGSFIETGQIVTKPRRTLVIDRPDIEVIKSEDFIICPHDAECPEDALFVGDRKNETLASILTRAVTGVYDRDAVNRCRKSGRVVAGENAEIGNRNGNLDNPSKESDFDEPGQRKLKTSESLEVLHGVIFLDLDGDGESEWWVVSVETSTRTVLHCNPYTSSPTMLPYRPMTPMMKRAGVYGMCVGDLTEGGQAQMDSLVNLCLDAATMASTVFMVERGGGAKNVLSKNFKPGFNVVHLKDDESKIEPVRLFDNLNMDKFPAMEKVKEELADTTAMSETLTGRVSNGDSTATETREAANAGARRLQVMADRCAKALTEAHEIVHEMLIARNMKDGQSQPDFPIPYALDKANGGVPSSMTLQDFVTPVTFFVSGSVINTDTAIRLQGAEKILLAMENSPLAQTKLRRWYAEKQFLDAHEVPNTRDFIGTAEEASSIDKQAEQENQQNPPLALPSMPEKVGLEYFTALIVENPDREQDLMQVYEALASAGKPEPSPEEADTSEIDSHMTEAMTKLKEAKANNDIDVAMKQSHLDTAHAKLSIAAEKLKAHHDIVKHDMGKLEAAKKAKEQAAKRASQTSDRKKATK